MKQDKYIKLLSKNGFYNSRMISHSKSGYKIKNPYNKVIFNASFFVLEEEKLIQILWGDIDITLEGEKLKFVASLISKTSIIYVVPEYVIIKEPKDLTSKKNCNSIWNTNMKIQLITKEYIEELELSKEKEAFKFKKNALLKLKNQVNIKKSKELVFKDEIDLPFELLYKEAEKFKRKFYLYKESPKRDEGELYEEYFSKYGYFTYGILERFLIEYYNLEKNSIINPSDVWISRTSNKKLRHIDFKIEKLFNSNFKYTNFGRYVTCNYCVDSVEYSHLYKDNKLYVRDFEKKLVRKFDL